jgi:hypothetical protein
MLAMTVKALMGGLIWRLDYRQIVFWCQEKMAELEALFSSPGQSFPFHKMPISPLILEPVI